MKQDFIKSVDEKNYEKVRISLSNELLLDPRGSTFSEMLQYAVANAPDLFEENKEANYSVPPKADWDEAFLFKVKNDLDFNFSKEKLAFYEEVVKTVGKSKAERIEEEERQEKERKNAEPKGSDKLEKDKSRFPVNTVFIPVSAGGAILAIIGLAAEKTLLTVVGGAVLIVGGVILLTNNLKNK